MGVYTLVFHFYIRFAEQDHYALFLFCGLLPWIWVSSSLSEASSSIVSSGHLVTKSAFPAHVLPTVAVSTNLIHFLLALPVLVLFLLFSGKNLELTWIYVVPLVVLQYFFLHGIALCAASLNVFFRDVQHVVGNVLSLLFFLCPIVYPLSAIPEAHQITFWLNPFSLFTIGYQRAILDGSFLAGWQFLYLVVWSLVASLLGHYVYERCHEGFAEML
jgi:lipopolysaccharide transport system permease protein